MPFIAGAQGILCISLLSLLKSPENQGLSGIMWNPPSFSTPQTRYSKLYKRVPLVTPSRQQLPQVSNPNGTAAQMHHVLKLLQSLNHVPRLHLAMPGIRISC